MKHPLFQLQYELELPFSEAGTEKGAKLTSAKVDPELLKRLEKLSQMSYRDLVQSWSGERSDDDDSVTVLPMSTRTPEALGYRIGERHPRLIFITRPLHTIKLLDEYLAAANKHMAPGGILYCHTMTAALKRLLISQRYPWGISALVAAYEYLWHRVCPKLKLTKKLYFSFTQGKNRTFTRVEIIGRLYRAGFEVIDEQFRDGEYFVIAQQSAPPIEDTPPTGSPIIHLRRIGKGGQEIVVHKFRTMYTYSEYVQPYIYQYQNLERGGKFKEDYRVNYWGHLLRRLWLDEIPMVWNLIRGDIKLVGVRPLSIQYFNLYSPEIQQLRIRTKPGLLPPFYYDEHTPVTLDEVQESERRYLEAYLTKPFATDWRYFWGIVGNILFHRKHSA